MTPATPNTLTLTDPAEVDLIRKHREEMPKHTLTLTDPAEIELIRKHRAVMAQHIRIDEARFADDPAAALKATLTEEEWALYYEDYQTFHYIEDSDWRSDADNGVGPPHLWHYNGDGKTYTTPQVCEQIAVKVKEDNLRGSDIITWACVACDLELLDDHGIGFTPASQRDELYDVIMDGLEPFMHPSPHHKE